MSPVPPYDALLVLSFGGPEGPDDVMPFLQNVTRGRDVPANRLREVAEHYVARGGLSPINEQNRALRAALADALAAGPGPLPVYWGNRNWHPFVEDTLHRMGEDGVRRAAVFVTSAYSSYSGCRQYREDLADAVAAVTSSGGRAPGLDKLRVYFDHPGFLRANAERVADAASRLREQGGDPASARLLFVTHSIPVAMARTSGPAGDAYVEQHRWAAAAVVDELARTIGYRLSWELVFCSRSGPPHVPWLEPDVNDRLRELAAEGVRDVVLSPVGFVSDHMEVVHDLDVEALATAEEVGLRCVRAGTAGVHPAFIAGIVDLLRERAARELGVPAASPAARIATHDRCPADCCPNPRGPRAALCGVDGVESRMPRGGDA